MESKHLRRFSAIISENKVQLREIVRRIPSTILFGVAIVLLSFTVITVVTPYGLGMSQDSVGYLSAARSFESGRGLLSIQSSGEYAFMAHFPPLLSLLLSKVSEPIPHNAVMLQALLFSFSAIVAGLITWKLTKSRKYTIIASLLLVISQPMVYVHSQLWSEPLMILGILLVVVLAIEYENTRQKMDLGVLLLVTMLIPFSRYAALFLLPLVWAFTALIEFSWRPQNIIKLIKESPFRGNVLRKVGRVLLYAVFLITPYVLWQIYVKSQQSSIRRFSLHVIPFSKILQGMEVFANWILPFRVNQAGAAILVLFTLVAILLLMVRYMKNSWGKVPKNLVSSDTLHMRLSLFFIAAVIGGYYIFLLISISFFDYATPLDTRILAPIYPLILVLAVFVLSRVSSFCEELLLLKRVIALSALFFVVTIIYRGAHYIATSRVSGQPNANKEWAESETLKNVRILPLNIRLVSNSNDGIYGALGRNVALLPFAVDRDWKKIPKAEAQLLQYWMRDTCIVYFNARPSISKRFPALSEVKRILATYKQYVYSDGSILCWVER